MNTSRVAHLKVAGLFMLLTILMTYPTILHLTSDEWLMGGFEGDVFAKLWDSWYLRHHMLPLNNGSSYWQTTGVIFYPQTVDLTYHNFNIVHMVAHSLLTPVLGQVGAFNLVGMIAVWLNAFSAYLITYAWLKRPLPAILAGGLFGFSQWSLVQVAHPEQQFIFIIPLTLYSLYYTVQRRDWRLAIVTGLLAGLSAWIGIYLLLFTAITLTAVVIVGALHHDRWRDVTLYQLMALTATVGLIVVLPKVIPQLMGGGLTTAVSEQAGRPDGNVDLINMVVPVLHPMWGAAFRQIVTSATSTYYLGWLTLILLPLGLLTKDHRRWALLCVAGILFFGWASLGPVLEINSQFYPNLWMLKRGLDSLSVAFRVIGRGTVYFIGLMLPLSMLAACGLLWIIERIPRYTSLLAGVIIAATLFDVWLGPYISTQSFAISPFYTTQLDGSALKLPPDGSNNQRYLYYQTRHGYPMSAGLVARAETIAFDHPLTAAWLADRSPATCDATLLATLPYDVIILHGQVDFTTRSGTIIGDPEDQFERYPFFASQPIHHQDDEIIVYDAASLTCP